MLTDCVQQNHGLWRKMHLSGVENTGHIGLALEMTDGLCIAGSCLAIPVSTASGWTLVMFK